MCGNVLLLLSRIGAHQMYTGAGLCHLPTRCVQSKREVLEFVIKRDSNLGNCFVAVSLFPVMVAR